MAPEDQWIASGLNLRCVDVRLGSTRPPSRPRRGSDEPTYRLYLEDGSDAGEYRTAGWGFEIGDVIHLGPDRPGWRILEIAQVPDDAPYAGLWMVEPLTPR
jgi:hypothetical protein